MSTTLSFLLSALLLYKYWALFLIFFLAALVLPVPTSSVLLATGAFASQGYFDFFISLAVIVGSNVLGDLAGYLVAQRYGRKAFHIMHIRVPVWIERMEGFLRKHPGSTIFLTRFVGTTDVLANLLCGFGGVSVGAFLFYDAVGNIISDGYLLYAGYFLGIHWQDFTGLFNITDYIIVGVIVAVILSVFVWRKRKKSS